MSAAGSARCGRWAVMGILLAAWLAGVVYLEAQQFEVMPCSEAPAFSIATGFVLFGTALGVPAALVFIWTSRRPVAQRLFLSAAAILVAIPLVALSGFFWVISHVCP